MARSSSAHHSRTRARRLAPPSARRPLLAPPGRRGRGLRRLCTAVLVALVVIGAVPGLPAHPATAAPAGTVTSWGDDRLGQVSGTPDGGGFAAVAGGAYHSLALRS